MEKLILECMVRSALIALCTAAALYALRVKTARVRHSVWAAVVVLMLVLPLWTAWGPKAVLRVLTPERALINVQPAVETAQTDIGAPPVSQREAWTRQNGLAAIYLLGLCGLLARLGIGTMRARKLTSESCVAPITVGWLTPVVILPAGWKQWSQAKLDAVLAHEGEHVRRRDPLVQWMALLNRAVFWFHPLAWWLERRLAALAEEACDDAVLMRGNDPLQYSECLLELARLVQQAGVRVSVIGMAMPGNFLPQRIRRIVAGVPVQPVSRGRIIGVAVACAVVSTVFTVGAVGYQSDVSSPNSMVQPLLDSRGSEAAVRKPEAIVRKKATVLLAQAQANPATTAANSLWGTVVDPSNAVVPNASLTLVGSDNQVSISTATNAIGAYSFLNITPGTYSLNVKVPGFKSETRTNIQIAPGEAHSAGTMALQVGDVFTSITVTGSRSAPVSSPAPTGLAVPAPQPSFHSPPPPSIPAGAFRVGGNVQATRLINALRPVYPADLQEQGVQGTVKIEGIISKEGLLLNARVVSIDMDPRLAQPALDAVNRWRFQPTMLDGQPVEVMDSIDINFQLNN